MLERDGRGLNLTHEVRDGILNHTGPVAPESLEGRIVKLVDRVAYINHDIDDALRAGVLDADRAARRRPSRCSARPARRASTRSCTTSSRPPTSPATSARASRSPRRCSALRAFLFERVYGQGPLREEADRAGFVVRSLFAHFCEHPDDMDDGEPADRPRDARRPTTSPA